MKTIKKAKLRVANQMYHHHAFEIINSHNQIREQFLSNLQESIECNVIKRKRKGNEYEGIEADFLNQELRNILKSKNKIDLKFEAFEEDGVFYFSQGKSKVAGFDFAIINDENNLIKLRNLCFGKLQYADRDKRWKKFLKNNSSLEDIANSIYEEGVEGSDLLDTVKKETPLIVGEIQFGNWALVYRDFFKVLKADVFNNVDCLIYIVPTGHLEGLLSDGIVTFDKTEKIIKEFEKVLTVPVWLIGIDIEFDEE